MRFCFYLIFLLFSFSCANKTLIRDTEYQPVYRTLERNNPDEALLVFPQKEDDGFITTFEKAWIKYWTEKKLSENEIQKVQQLSDQIEKRKFVSISNEASIFLVGESEDGYIPSEHEVISLHLFLAMLYLDQNKLDSAHVELKRAVEYIANNPDGKETTFDDAAIRIWLASLWDAVGDRNSADVDLRKAMELSNNKAMSKLINQNKRKIQIIMRGLGPRTNWSANGQSFFFDYKQDKSKIPIGEFEFSTRSWYDWHRNRNTKLREKLLTSHYMANSLGFKTSRASQKTFGVAASGLMYTAAVGVALAGFYAATQVAGAGSDNIIYLSLGLSGWIALKADELYQSVDHRIEESKKREAALLQIYRMVRFLPSSIEYIDENLTKSSNRPIKGFTKTLGSGHNQVEFIWNPE